MLFTILTVTGTILTTVGGAGFIRETIKEKAEKAAEKETIKAETVKQAEAKTEAEVKAEVEIEAKAEVEAEAEVKAKTEAKAEEAEVKKASTVKAKASEKSRKASDKRRLYSNERTEIVRQAEEYLDKQEKEANTVSDVAEELSKADSQEDIDDVVNSEAFKKIMAEATKEAIAEEKARAAKSRKRKK